MASKRRTRKKHTLMYRTITRNMRKETGIRREIIRSVIRNKRRGTMAVPRG